MPPVNVLALDTDAFGRWAQRARLVLPVPLNTGYAARVTLDWDELLEVSEDRLDLDNASTTPRALVDLPEDTHELLDYAEAILRNPQTAVFAARVDAGRGDVLVVGLTAGADGLVVVDTSATMTIRKTTASDVAATVVRMLPAVRGLRMDPVSMDERALPVLSAGASARGLDRTAYNAATAAGLSAESVLLLAKLQDSLTARGTVGALRFGGGAPTMSTTTADWFESSAGSVLKRPGAPGQVVFEAATPASMTSAAITAMAGAR